MTGGNATFGEVLFWSIEIVLSIILAWGATRFWKHRPMAVGSGGVLIWLVRWRPHLFYFGGWLSYIAYMFFVRPEPAAIDGWPVLSFALMVVGLVDFDGSRLMR